MAKLNREQAFALAGEREWMDIPEQLGEDSNKILSSALGSLDNSIVGDVLRAVKGKPFRQQVEMVLSRPDISQKEKDRIASEYLNADTILQQGQKALKDYSQFWAKRKSKKSQAADKYVAEAEGDNELEKGLNTIGRYIENPATIGLQTIGQFPQLLAPAGLAVGLRTKAAQALLQKAGVSTNAATGLGSLGYQVNVGGQQAREQSLEDSAENRPLSEEEEKAFNDENYIIDPSKINKNAGESNRYTAAKIATDTGSKISGLAGLIGLKSDLALTNLLMGESIKGLSKKGLKAAAGHLAKNIAEETIDEAGSPIGANIGAQKTYEPNREIFKGVGKQAAAGAVLGAGMGSVQAGSLYLFGDGDKNNEAPTADDLAKSIIRSVPKQDIPKQYQDSFNAFEDAKQAEAQAQAAYEANPTPESEEALAQATDARLKANNQFSQYDAAFKQTFTEQEQKDLLANDLKGIAARAKLAQEAEAQRQAELAEQQKAQRENLVKGLSAFVGNEAVLLNEIDQLGLDEAQSEQLLKEVYQFKQPSSKQAKSNKTPLEKAVDAHFDAKGNRDHKVMSQDVADKYKLPLKEVLRGVLERTRSQEKAKQDAERQAKMQSYEKNKQAEEKLTEQQQLENILADFAAENDTDSMLALLQGRDKAESDTLFNNAFDVAEKRAKEADKALQASQKAAKAQEQAKQTQAAFNADMTALYASNPNATYNDWKAVGKKHGITSAIDLANAWASARANKTKQKDEQKPKNTETLALPAPSTVMVTDAQGNTIQTTENNVPKKQRNADVSVPSGLNIDVSNAANTQRDRGVGSYSGSASNLIVRQDGKPFPTEQVAQQALTNKTTKKTKTKNNEPVISKDTHTVVPVDGGYAIAPVESQPTPMQDDVIGEYAHNQFADAVANVTKTDKGYDVNWGDEVQSFTGKNAADKTQAALKKENFNKKNPDGDNGGVPVEPTPNKPVSPVDNAQTTPKVTQNTTGEQIAEAFDKTAKAITEASHAKVVERVKNGEEIVYKKPDDVFSQAAAILPVEEKGRVASIYRGTPEEQSKFSSVERVLKTNPATGRAVPLQKVDLSNKRTSHLFDLALDVFGGKPDKNSGIKDSSDIIAINPDKDSLIAYDKDGRLKFFMLSTDGKTWKYMGDVASKPDVSNPSIQAAQRVSPMGGNNTPQTAPKTTGEQIAHAMDKTAQAITDAAHSKVVERIKNGEEIVYKQPAAIERVKQDERYQVELNDKGHAVVKNVKDNDGNWVGSEPIVTKEIKQSKPVNRQINPEKDNILVAISKAGGLKRSEAIARKAIDKAYFGKRGAGLLPVFRANEDEGLSLDAMAEILSGYGYPVHEGGNSSYDSTNGSYSPNALEDALIEALNGKDIGTFEYKQRKAQEYYDAQMKEAEELERLFNSKGSSTWDEADALDVVATTIEQELIKGESTADISVLSETLKEVENVTDTRISGQNNDSTTKAQGTKTSIAEAIEEGKAGQQKSEGGTRQNTGLQGLTLTSQTEASRKQEEDSAKAAEAKRLAEEKAAKDKAQADKELNDFRLTGSNAPADIDMAGGQKDMFAAPTRGERAAVSDDAVKSNDTVSAEKESEYNGFTDNMSAKEAGRVKSVLSVTFDYGDLGALSRSELIEQFAKQGVFSESNTEIQRIKAKEDHPDAYFTSAGYLRDKYVDVLSLGGFTITKTEHEYSQYLFEKNKEKEDLEGFASKITPINKTDEEMKADWLAKNNIKIDEQSNEENSIKSTKLEGIIKVDFPLEETVNAWQHSIRNPSGVAKSFKQTYEDYIKRAYDLALPLAETNAQREALEQASLKLQQDYIQKFKELNSARSGVTSSFIAGRNNFNGKQAESRGNAFDKVSESFDKWTTSKEDSLKLAVIAARSPEQLAKIKAEKDAKEQELQDKNDEFLRKVLDFKKGDDFTIGKNQYKVVRVNRNKDGMPISLTLEGEGLIKGIDDKISLFGRGMAYPTINDLREAVARVQKKDESELIPKKSDNEDLAPVEKAQQAKKDAFLNTEIDSQYGKVTKRQLIDNLINDGWTLTTGWTEDKAKGKALDAELERLKRTAPIGNSSHPDTVRLNELKNLAKESPHKERGQFFFKETTYRLESPTGQLKQLSKTELDYVNEVLANKEPRSVEAEQEPVATNPDRYNFSTAKDILDADLSIDEKLDEAQKLLNREKQNAAKNKVKLDESNKFYLSNMTNAENGYLYSDLPRNASLSSVIHANVGIDVGFIEFLKKLKVNPQKTSVAKPDELDNEDTMIGDSKLSDLMDADMSNKATGSPELRIARQSIFDAENAALKVVENKDIAYFAKYAGIFPKTYSALLELFETTTNHDRELLGHATTAALSIQTKQEPTKTEEKPAEKPSISDKQANREKIRITMLQATNREKALALAVKLTEEMPDMDYEITSELQSVIQHNKWLGIEIKMPKTPFKGDSDAEVKKSITQLQKAFDGTGYSFNLIGLDKNSVMGQLSFSKDFSTRLNYIRNSKDIWVLFDNNYSNAGSLEFLDPVAKAITKWLNGENVEPFMAGIDPNWDIQFKSIPRVIADKLSAAKEKGENSTGGTSEKLPDNSFMDKSLPVNTGVNARMVVIDKQESNNQDSDSKPKFSRSNRVSDIDNLYLDAIKRGDIEEAQRLVIEAAEKAGVPIINDESATAYKVRRSATPIRTQKAYKLFRVKKSQKGEVFALFVGNKDPLPQGVWLDAIPGEAALNPKTGEPTKVKSSLGALAYRPGWHAGDIPLATHIGAMDKEGNIFARKDDEVWAEVEMIADIDYQPEANENGIRNGKFSPAYADIKRMPVDGLYRYKTNANMTGNWIISSSMKINKILTEDEVNSILIANNAKTMPWAKEVKTKDKTEKTDSRSQKVWEKTNLDLAKWGLTDNPAKNQQKLLDPITYDDNGNIIPLSERFNIESDDPRYSSQSSTIGDRTITQVRDKLISRFGKRPHQKRIIEQLESKGILKIHQSMSDKDIPAEALRQVAYHGSPHKFDKFSLEHLGSGEGAQVYGWGLYFTDLKEIASGYADKLTKHSIYVNGKEVDSLRGTPLYDVSLFIFGANNIAKEQGKESAISNLKQAIRDGRIDYNEATKAIKYLESLNSFSIKKDKQKLYKVNIPEDNTMLLWDKPLSKQSEQVKSSIKSLIRSYDELGLPTSDLNASVQFNETGESFYRLLSTQAGNPRNASTELKDNGISGIKYLDGSSRFAGTGTYNYVIFDDNAVEILKTYYSAQQGVTEGFYLNGTIHLIADNLTDETIIPTFVHELSGHKGFQEMMSPKAYELIMQQFDRLVAQGNAIAIKAKQRAEKAEKDTARQQDEYIPYLLTEQAKNEQATPQQRNAVQRLIDHIVRAVKGWVVRTLSKYDTTYNMSRRVAESLTPADILYMAERMVGDIAKRGGDNNSRPKFGKSEQSQFDQLLAKADKMIAEQGKLLAPNGKPSKLNRYQWAQVRTDKFKNWFGDWEGDAKNASKVVDENGEPMVVYHGTNKDFTQFNKLSWVAYNPSLANDYAELKSFNRGGNSQVIATFVRAINPFNADLIKKIKPSEKYPYGLSVEAFIDSIENQSKIPRGTLDNLKSIIQKGRREEESGPTYSAHNFWNDAVSMFGFEGKNAIDQAIKEAGFDSIFYTEQEVLTVGLFEPTQIKSAIGNNGEFSSTNPDIRFSQLNTPQTQINAVRKKYEGTSQWMKAPNGQPTKLNEMQWLQVRTPNFKAWFGNWENDPANASKVVDENGEPLVVYRGETKRFNVFSAEKAKKYGITGKSGDLFFFTSNKENAKFYSDGGGVKGYFLSIRNPFSEDGKNPRSVANKAFMENYESENDTPYDGAVSKDTLDGPEYSDIWMVFPDENGSSTQIKSAISNNGEFSPTNPDIRFSRAEENSNSIEPTQESDNKKLNSLLHGWLGGKGEKTYEAVSSSVRGFLSRMPSSMALVNNAPPAFKQMMREMIRDSKQAELTVSDILKNSTSLKAEERTLLSDYLEKELALGITPPEDVVKVGAAMRMALSYQTDELVRLGMLSTESAARWRDTYLPRMYKEKKKDPITQAIVKRFDIKGEHLKGRGQFKEVDSSEVANYLELGWEDRGVSSKGKTIVWKDYTKEEREKMGEIRDAMLRFATGFLSTQRDIAVAKLFEKIAANEELASSEPVAGWVQIPKAFIQQTGGLMRYGKLSGMWVHPDVWENTKHYIQDRGDIERIYRKTLSIWKEGKTALNVVAHTNNIVSNVVMVTAAGANINDIRKGFDSLSNKDKYYKEAVEMGMMATGHYTGDIRDYFGDDLLGATTPTNFVFKALKKAWENPVFNKMREFYDLEDQMFRLTLYRKAREYGATQQQAVDYAETFIFNYADLPVGVKKIRDFGLPFISYTYKAVPAMTRLAFTQPHRMLAITGATYGLNALAYALLGLDGDDEDKERASIPDYMQGRSAWGIPKLVRLPFGDTENPVFLDVYRWLPLGDFFSMNDRTGGVPIPTSAVFSGPYWNAYNTLIANRNGLTGGDYFEDTDSDKQTFIKSMRFGLSEWIPMYYHLDKNLNAITREFSDTPMSNLLNTMGYSGTDARGNPADLLYSSLGAIGIKARKFDVLAEQEKRYDEYDYKIKALRREMRSIARDMSNTHQERDIEDKLKEIERLLNERDEMVKSLE